MVVKYYKLVINGCCNMLFLDYLKNLSGYVFEKLLLVILKKNLGCNN